VAVSEKSPEERLAELTTRVKAQEEVIAKLVEIMVGRGTLTKHHQTILAKTANKVPRSLPQVRVGSGVDKYSLSGVDIDCASLVHLCGARCCKLSAALGTQDIEEGKLEWEIDQPYVIKRANDGYCNYVGERGGCSCYDIRPTVCREFDCRDDKRIWKDFEARIPADEPFLRIYPEQDAT